MRNLAVRTLVWLLAALALVILMGRLHFENTQMEMRRVMAEICLTFGLGEHLAALDAAPRADRADVLAAFPARLRTRSTLVALHELPDHLQDAVVMDERPLWLDPANGDLWAQLEGDQLLWVDGVFRRPFGPRGLGLLLAMVVVVLSLASIAIAAPLVRRIQRLTRASQQVAAGELAVRVDDSSGDELGQLARQFDAMVAALQRAEEERRAFFRALAHELGTPLARMEFAVEMLEDTLPGPTPRQIPMLRRELSEMGEMTDELLEWVRLAPGAPRSMRPTAVDAVVEDLADRQTTPVTVELSGTDLTVEADPRGMARALDNLLRNAARYASGAVLIRVCAEPDAVVVWIEDDGPGIPAADREAVFEPFTRLDDSRDRASGGLGLGLSIVARILAHHGGSASAHHSQRLGGAAMKTRWPRAQS